MKVGAGATVGRSIHYSEGEPEMDLSGYKITLDRNAFGLWSWRATDPDGSDVPPMLLRGTYAGKHAAEKAALAAIEFHARPIETLNGEELRERVGMDAERSAQT